MNECWKQEGLEFNQLLAHRISEVCELNLHKLASQLPTPCPLWLAFVAPNGNSLTLTNISQETVTINGSDEFALCTWKSLLMLNVQVP